MSQVATSISGIDYEVRNSLQAYSERLLQITDKQTQQVVPFVWNRCQIEVHRRLERQRDLTGMVRAIILKPRQTGMSQYVCGRYLHRVTLNPGYGQRCYILTHEDEATNELFTRAKNMWELLPNDYRPATKNHSAKELNFANLRSGYRVGTAKNISGTGRGQTNTLFHGSECAFWSHPKVHFAGSIQSIPAAPGTEIILESTANGQNNEFHRYWTQAVDGKNEYQPIFFPWMWAAEYRRNTVPSSYEPSDEELEYASVFDLDDAQVAWMHYKNIELHGDPGELGWLFRQEYPATADEAFQTSGNSFISSIKVILARRNELPWDQHAPRVLGVDSALANTKDETFAIDRCGWNAGQLVNERIDTDDQVAIAERIAYWIELHDFHRVFVDYMPGKGVVDILRRMGYSEVVRAVHFSSKPLDTQQYTNKRSEMWGCMKDWVSGEEQVSIPDDDKLAMHLTAPQWGPTATRQDEKGRLRIEPKEDMKKRLEGFSPDRGDALALTFAETVVVPSQRKPSWRDEITSEERRGGFMAS